MKTSSNKSCNEIWAPYFDVVVAVVFAAPVAVVVDFAALVVAVVVLVVVVAPFAVVPIASAGAAFFEPCLVLHQVYAPDLIDVVAAVLVSPAVAEVFGIIQTVDSSVPSVAFAAFLAQYQSCSLHPFYSQPHSTEPWKFECHTGSASHESLFSCYWNMVVEVV